MILNEKNGFLILKPIKIKCIESGRPSITIYTERPELDETLYYDTPAQCLEAFKRMNDYFDNIRRVI